MPNWSETVIKLFVRPQHAHFAKDIIASLATPGMDTSDLESQAAEDSRSVWLDLEALLPIPAGLQQAQEIPEYEALVSGNGRGASNRGEPAPTESHRRAMDLFNSNMAAYGVATAYDWQRNRWGTKWNATGSAPRVEDADDHDAYHEFQGATMITYRITTPWCEPGGYLSVLRDQCERRGIGLRVWVSHEDGGTKWNPDAEEYQTVWEELDTYNVDLEDMASSDMLVIAGQGLRFEPSDVASQPLGEPDPLERILRDHTR